MDPKNSFICMCLCKKRGHSNKYILKIIKLVETHKPNLYCCIAPGYCFVIPIILIFITVIKYFLNVYSNKYSDAMFIIIIII